MKHPFLVRYIKEGFVSNKKMSLLEKWKINVNLEPEFFLNPSWLDQTSHLKLDLETKDSTLLDIPEIYLQNKLLDKGSNTSFSFPIEPLSPDNLLQPDYPSAELVKKKHLVKQKRKIKNESRSRSFPKIAKKKNFVHRLPKRRRISLGDTIHPAQKKKLACFPYYTNLPIDDDDDGHETVEDKVANMYQFTPLKVFPDTTSANEKTRELKAFLIQFVASSLVIAPNFKSASCESSNKLQKICSEVAEVDPEFVLKVALYGRQELNIRSASNYLVAFAAMHGKCKKFVRKYYKAIVVLPSDWIEIAEFCLYQKTYQNQFGVLPVCLRRSMVEKFTDFDVYQLAKYNKTTSKITHSQLEDGSYPDRATRIEKMKEAGDKLFTLKQLIRQLHISKPAQNVMSLLGKKYPEDLQQFYESGLDGIFDDKMSGKRMKLPVPETWETQISLHGNKAKVWQSLIDNKKLPYMAMLRNVRNLIKAKISSKHEKIVLNRLANEKSVINSRQLPTQFFSAYSVLEKMEKELEAGPAATISSIGHKRKLDNTYQEITYNKSTLDAFRAALDTAIKVATTHNLEPIKGKTVIICCLDMNSHHICNSAKGFGRSWSVKEIAILLGLMCHYSCEKCELVIWNEKFGHFIAKVESGNILENVKTLLNKVENKFESVNEHREENKKNFNEYLFHKLETREKIDTLIQVEECEIDIKKYKTLYRLHVDQDLLFVNISLMANNRIILPESANSPDNDITIKGFSVQLLNFIATYRNESQLMHVEKIDVAYNLKATASAQLSKSKAETKTDENAVILPDSQPPSKMKTVRVFISSTFNDMHGERNLLTRFIFPKLRKWAEKRGINIYEVDLRWGIPEEEARSSRNLELCLSEISSCDFFIGILGERYGWIPSVKDIPSAAEFDWVRDYPNKNASITELEMCLGALSQPEKAKEKAFFFFRDNNFEMDVPKRYLQYFMSENSQNIELMQDLKKQIRNSGLEVFDGYPAEWGGIVDGKAFVSGLDEFGKRIFNQIKNAVEKLLDSQVTNTVTEDPHQRYVKRQEQKFVGRKILVDHCLKMISTSSSGVITVTGKPGCGKSAVMAKLIQESVSSKVTKSSNILVNIVGAAPDSTNIMSVLSRFCWQMQASYNLNKPLPKDYMLVINRFFELLGECTEKSGHKMLVFIDGLDNFEEDYQPYNLAWLSKISNNVVFVLSVQAGELYHKLLHSKKHVNDFVVGDLTSMERAEMVRRTLAIHRKALEESLFNNQMRLLTYKMEATSPFYLKLACEELRVFGVFEKLTDKLKSLPRTISNLLQEVFERLEQELGKDVVHVSLSLLSCAKNGLLGMELYELMNLHWKLEETVKDSIQNIQKMSFEEIVSKPAEDYLSRSKFVRLHYVLQHFLNFDNTPVRSNMLIITHKLTKAAIHKRYLTSSSINYYHKLLAAFFYQKSDCNFSGLWTGEDPRSFSILLYHLVCSGSISILVSDLLCNLHFIYSMCKFGLASLLLEYFSPQFPAAKKIVKTSSKLLMGKKVLQFKLFITHNLHILSKCPSLLWQQVVNCPTDMHYISLPSEENISGLIKLQNRPKSQGNRLLMIDSFSQPLTCVALCEEDSLLACGSNDGVVYLLDSQTGKELQRFIGHSNAITDVCFLNANYLCSASLDTKLSLWDIQNGHRISIMNGHKRKVTSCCVNSQKNLIASASFDKTTRIWNPHKGEEICCFSLKWPVNCVAFHPEGNKIIIGCWDSTLQIWDIIKQSKIAVIRGHKSSVQAVTYSPSGNHIMSTSMEGNVKIWAANNGVMIGNIPSQTGLINKIAFNSQGNMMATVDDDCKLKLWTSQLGTLLQSLQEENSVPATCVCLSPQISTVAVGYHDGKVRQFDVSTGVEISKMSIHLESVTCIKYSLNEEYLVTGCADSTVKMFRIRNGQTKAKLSHHSNSVMCVDICRKYLVSSSLDMTVCLYELDSSFGIQTSPLVLTWHDAPVTSCALNFNETFLATAGRDRNVAIWDLAALHANKDKMNPLKVISKGHKDWITDCKWSNSNSNLVTSSNDFNLKVWNLATAKPLCELVGHTAPINSVSYRNGVIVSCSSDGCTKVWSEKGFEITSLYGHLMRVNCCDVKVSGESYEREKACNLSTGQTKYKIPERQKNIILATCGDSGLVQIWEPMKSLELACLTGHTDKVVGLSFQKDLLATCSVDGSLRLWSPPDKSSEISMTNLGDEITGGDFNPVLHIAILSCRNGTIQLWDCKDITNPIQLITPKLSNFSINCICFCDEEGKLFGTGSDNKMVTIWNLIPKGKSFIIRKKFQYTCEMPVHSLHYFQLSKKTEAQIFVSAGLCGRISVYCSNTNISIDNEYISSEPILTFSSLYNGSQLELLTLSSPRTIQNWTLSPNSELTSSGIRIGEEVACSLLMDEVPEDVKLTSACKTETLNYVGLSNGRLLIEDVENKSAATFMLHPGSSLDQILALAAVIFTAGDDGVIKAWTPNFQQIGEFHCSAAVTCLIELKSTNDEINFMAGDRLGYVYCLSMKL